MDRVAVITRTKDRPIFLERAIASVQEQSYEDFVQVIIDDGGDASVVDALVEKHKDLIKGRVKVIHNKTSLGMEAASNKAIKSIASEFVAIHDDDDTWHPDFLKLAVEKLEEASAIGVVARAVKITEGLAAGKIEQLKTEPWMPDLKVINLYRQCVDNQMTPIMFLYRREALDQVGYYNEDLPVLGDWDFGIRFLQKYDVEFLDPGYALAFYHHREASGNSSDSNFGASDAKHRYYANKLMNKYLREELASGQLGVGYIMSRERYQQNYMARLAHRVMPSFVASRLKRRATR